MTYKSLIGQWRTPVSSNENLENVTKKTGHIRHIVLIVTKFNSEFSL